MIYKVILLQSILIYSCSISANSDTSEYTYGVPSNDGIGKYYLGREISQVMGHLGAAWLERDSRNAEENTELLIENLPLSNVETVADIGAGTGYFTFRMAKRIKNGKVIAVDIQDEMLELIRQGVDERKIDNVKTVKGSVKSVNLPDNSVELILMVDAYHEFSYPYEMGQSMFEALKPGGHLVLVEYKAEDESIPIKRLHKMTEEQVKKEIGILGLVFERNGQYLPRQHVLTFRKK